MKREVIVLDLSVLTPGSALASDKGDIMAVLKQWNDTDEAKAVATCADDATVIDYKPPFEWHGPSACSRWQKDYDAYAQKEGIIDATGTIGKGHCDGHVRVAKTAAGWRITAWTWTTENGS